MTIDRTANTPLAVAGDSDVPRIHACTDDGLAASCPRVRSASVTTRQIVAFDGGGAGAAPARRYRSASTGGGTSFTQPAIAV
jgi:hypothetical protein